MKFPQKLRLRGCEGVSVPDQAALNAGVSRYVGKPTEEVAVPDALVLGFYRKAVLLGELAPVDKASADMLGVAFDAPKPSKPKEG